MDIKSIRIVSIDDNDMNLKLIETFAGKIGLEVTSFTDPLQALNYIYDNRTDLIIVDYMMPVLDGITLIQKVREKYEDIPIIMITAVNDNEKIKVKALEAGATEFLTKPLNTVEFTVRIRNLANLANSQHLLKDKAGLLEAEIKKATEKIVQREYEALEIIGRASEFKDMDTANHVKRVAHYSRLIAENLYDDEETPRILYHAAPLHDLGKIGIKDSLLLKPGKLDDEEFAEMKKHCSIGAAILEDCEGEILKTAASIAMTHHEKFDGSGYPAGLKGEDIPVFGRIVAVVDVFDALISQRPYKEPWTFDRAIEFIQNQSGIHFDPEIVDIFLKNIDSVAEIYNKYKD